jgi:hypothetical protein
MTTTPEEFRRRLLEIVQGHYTINRAPLLLSRLGAEIEKAQLWPEDRAQRSLKQLIEETCGPDLQIVRDKLSPAYVAVVTPEVREQVEAQIAERPNESERTALRLESIARPVLLAFCIDVKNQPVYVRRIRPFRYEVGTVPSDRISEYVLVDSEYRRPGLRIDNLSALSQNDKRDLESLIQKWAAVHGMGVDQFSKLDQEEREGVEKGRTALDRLLAAQPDDIAQRILIPADIAQILTRIP